MRAAPLRLRMTPLKRTEHFRGRVVHMTVDEVLLPNGHRTQLDVVHHPGGAAVAAIDAEQRVCLLRQYRYVADGWLWELPAGKLEMHEAPLATAQRELIEEAGRSATEWHSLGSYLSSPGVFTEVIHLFLATTLSHWVALDEARRWALDGTIRDGKTALGVLRAASRGNP